MGDGGLGEAELGVGVAGELGLGVVGLGACGVFVVLRVVEEGLATDNPPRLELLAIGRPGAVWMLVVMQTMEPTCTVLVERRLGVVLLKARPLSPVPSPFLKGVHVMLSTGTPVESTR